MSAFGIEVNERAIRVFQGALTKHEALDQLCQAIERAGHVPNSGVLLKAVLEREAVMSTGIGGGVAIPHVRIEEVRRACIGVGLAREGIDYGTLDNQPVHVVVLFAMPAGSQKEYLGFLAQVMGAMKTPKFLTRLLACSDPHEVATLLNANP